MTGHEEVAGRVMEEVLTAQGPASIENLPGEVVEDLIHNGLLVKDGELVRPTRAAEHYWELLKAR